MSGAELVVWAAGLGIALAVGWAHGRKDGSDAPLPPSTGDWRAGYMAGYEDARQEALRVAKAHDFAAIERQVGRMKARP